ncbi:hypothetical protein LCGC14_1905490, partial [marine sediment metagenome]
MVGVMGALVIATMDKLQRLVC